MAGDLTLGPGLHDLSALRPGHQWETGTVPVTEAMITDFAALTGDANPLHLSDAAAQAAGFPGRLAHGLLVISLLEGLKARSPVQLATHTALGWQVAFRAPVRVGDLLSARVKVQEVRQMGRKGLVILEIEGWTTSRVVTATARYFGHFTR